MSKQKQRPKQVPFGITHRMGGAVNLVWKRPPPQPVGAAPTKIVTEREVGTVAAAVLPVLQHVRQHIRHVGGRGD